MVFTGSVNRTAETRPRKRGTDQRRPVDRAVQLLQLLLQAVLLNAALHAATLNRLGYGVRTQPFQASASRESALEISSPVYQTATSHWPFTRAKPIGRFCGVAFGFVESITICVMQVTPGPTPPGEQSPSFSVALVSGPVNRR